MKKIFFVLVFFFFSSANLLAEYRLEPVNCTLKKKSNCGAYLYNSKTGATYFCNSDKCTEIQEALEEGYAGSEITGKSEKKESKKSKIPKFGDKKKKKSKIPKFKKSN
tara:strand:- start:217 stop:540 length:324 start_codon:yes stop_codon:yes gene_type:complete